MLHLHHRKLGDISILGKLKKLEILGFFASHISELPGEMEELKKSEITGPYLLPIIKENSTKHDIRTVSIGRTLHERKLSTMGCWWTSHGKKQCKFI